MESYQKQKQSVWPLAFASIVFSIATIYLLNLYATFHWTHPHPSSHALDQLHIFRIILSLLALIWAIGSLKYKPKWISWCALFLSILAILSAFVVM